MPASPGAVLPRDMNPRQWSEFLTQSGIQADRTLKTFTPVWTGFSVDPVGDISYYDFGALVMMWTDSALVGTSDSTDMAITNIPAAIYPRATASSRFVPCIVVDNGTAWQGYALIGVLPDTMTFHIGVVSGSNLGYSNSGFTNPGDKGLNAGTLIIYPK